MKKLSKKIVYAKEYDAWEKNFGTNNHDEYVSSGKFHKDILAELLIIQNGLCAYTEYRLISLNDIEELKSKFKDEKFTGEIKDYPIDLEHFDSRLKKLYGWKWSNFFAVYTTINQKVKRREEALMIKNGSSVHNIMKPDNEDFNPLLLLDYDKDLDMFIPNSNLQEEQFKEVKEMIICLGLNNAYIKDKRINYYKELRFLQSIGETIILNQFHTGWEIMSLR